MKHNNCAYCILIIWYGSINIIVNILKTTNTDINRLLKKNTWKIQKIMLTFFYNHYLSQNGKNILINSLTVSQKYIIYVRIILVLKNISP